MKNLILSLFLLVIGTKSLAQSCCSTEFATNDGNMSVFMKDKTFVDTHLSPLDYKHTSIVGGEMIQFKTADTIMANAYFIKAKTKSKEVIDLGVYKLVSDYRDVFDPAKKNISYTKVVICFLVMKFN